MDYLEVYPIHRDTSLVNECCDLINSEWPRSKSARLQSLYMSSDKFPTSLVLILNEQQVVGHVKLTEIQKGGRDVMVESMIIHKDHRGKGWGKVLMEAAERYVEGRGKTKVYLSTKGQEGFYKKLGYEVCQPVMYFGFCDLSPKINDKNENQSNIENKLKNEPPDLILKENQPKKDPKVLNHNIPPPPPPPLPKTKKPRAFARRTAKTYMCKSIV